ncbi:MAG: sigma-70 family RNA polymerase sigma factor [Chitinophagaceae bacterium]|nr:MAG: sigma-70 family RNA polymerase sigma factor [Chitinophagaceae bacterium]
MITNHLYPLDQALWQHIASSDPQAYSEVYVYYFKRLFNYGRKFTEEETLIEDAIQETFITLWNYRHRMHSIKSPQSYLFYTFRNTLFYKLKQEKKRGMKEDAAIFEPEFNAEHLIIKAETDAALQKELQKALEQLPARQREAIFLRFYEELPYEQIAEVMQISVHATYKSVSKALIQLRDKMGLPMGMILFIMEYMLR